MSNEIKEEQVTNINDRILSAENAILKVLRLQDGTDIVGPCFFFENEDFMVIAQPMVIHYSRDIEKETTSIHLFPWLPIEIAGENVVEIKLSHIITSFITTDEFMDEYFSFVSKIESIMNTENDLEYNDVDYKGIIH